MDAVLSDMTPSATSIRQLENEYILELCYNILRFALLELGTVASVLINISFLQGVK